MKKLLILLVLLFAGQAGQAWGATWYVKKIDSTLYYKSGSVPTITDTTIGDIEAVVELAGVTTGDNVYLCTGTYTGTNIDSDSLLDVDKALGYIGGAPPGVAGCSGTVTLDFNGTTGYGLRPSVHCGSLGACTMGRMTLTGISAAATNYNLYTTGNNWIFEDLTISGGYRGIYAGSVSNIFNRTKISGTANTAIWTVASSVFNYGIIENSASGVVGSASPVLNNFTVNGIANEAIENTSTGNITIQNSQLINIAYSAATKYPLKNDSTGTITFTNSEILPNVGDLTKISNGGTVTIANPVYKAPMWKHARREGVVVFGTDDLDNLSYFTDVVVPALNQYGWKGTLALSQPSQATVGNWATVQQLIASGHSIAAHGEKFANLMTDRNAFTVQYIGAGSACNMVVATVGDWAGTINTTATGAAGDSKIITILSTDSLSDIAGKLGANYTVIVNNADTNHNGLPVKYLASATYADIKTASVQVDLDHARIAYGEMRDTKTAIETNVTGYTVNTWIHPGNAADATTRSDLKSLGYMAARGSGANGESQMSSINIFNLKPQSLFTLFGSDANPQNTTGKVESYVGSVCEYLKYSGGITAFYSHSLTELSADGWSAVLAEINKCGIKVMTLDEAYQYIVANGSTSDNSTYTRTFTDLSDYRLLPGSSAINEGAVIADIHDQPGCVDADGNICWRGRYPDIGAYEYQSGPSYGVLNSNRNSGFGFGSGFNFQ